MPYPLHAIPRGRHRAILALLLSILVAPSIASAQHEHHQPARPDSAATPRDSMAAMPGMSGGGHEMDMMAGPLGISHVRMGSGTTWMPDSSPMHANHKMWGDWTIMLHGVAFAQYDNQGSKRGDRQFGVVDWEMLMAMRRIGSGLLHLHGMASLEPVTIGAKGYPLLLQTGESYRGRPLHDRQHPHDMVMELAAMFQQPIASNLAVELYGGIAGEPALGPVAFMHRPSAQNDPLSPLGHHWQDATHISYGVLTTGIYSRQWKLEGSWFNGREPDENRWNIDLGRLDSYSGRLTVNAGARLSLAGWYGYMPSPEALHPEEPVHRYGASVLHGGRGVRGGAWESMLLFGANEHAGRAENSVVAESNLEIGLKNALFARAEYVRKSAEDLVLAGVDPERQFDIRSLVGGYMREIGSIPGGTIGIGGRVSVNFVPSGLEPFYGTRTPAGFAVYVRVRPKRMVTEAMKMDMPSRAPMQLEQPMQVEKPMQMDHAMPAHDTTAIPLMPIPEEKHPPVDAANDMHDMHDMHEMHDSTAASAHADSGAVPAAPKATPAKQTKKTTPKKPAGKKPTAPAKPTDHQMPGMGAMPGMKMPADSTHVRKP